MIDINLIRENLKIVEENCRNRGYDEKIVSKIFKLDRKWRELKTEDDILRAKRNKISEEINTNKKQNKTINHLQKKENPIGTEENNKEIKKWGKISNIESPKSHLEIGEKLDIIDIKRATKIAGSGFYLLKGKGAKLQRALIQFMLNFHEKNGFIEINPPQLINKKTAFGTGNLPKFEDQLYKTNDELILIPTAEVPITNIYSNEILNEKQLPLKFCAITECYRTESGRKAGEEGLFRVHQFEKVEMVYICKPEDSENFLEEMTQYSERILEKLNIPYRKILLATADASFASAKTYDLEVWSPGMNKYLECSSCSNCTDFQARRMNTKHQSKTDLNFVHTLNGSGLALPRLMISILENNQQENGSIKIPEILWPYTE